METTTKYLVVCLSYNYNDEYYYQEESEGYKLTSPLFLTEELATAEAKRLNDLKVEKNGKWFCELIENENGNESEEPIRPYIVIPVTEIIWSTSGTYHPY